MAHLQIHCCSCGGTWQVYSNNYKSSKARDCPYCGHSIERQTWERQILPAFGMVADANCELYKDHVGYHAPMFTFDVVEDMFFANAQFGELNNKIEELSQKIEDLEDERRL